MIKNIEFCMRFYPHQINSIGTFVAVIKKNEQIENFYTKKLTNQIKHINHIFQMYLNLLFKKLKMISVLTMILTS